LRKLSKSYPEVLLPFQGRMTMTMAEEKSWIGVMPSYLPKLGAMATKIVSENDGNLVRKIPRLFATVSPE